MECNREEAARAKMIAERKLTERDFSGAKKFALKALNLYPDLEGVSQLMTTLEVYISAENKVSGEVDWYGILSVTPSADDETVKKQYRKLALMLHPDKNKSDSAEGAFKLISEAWSLLSDKTKRLQYNQRRSLRGPLAPPKAPSKMNPSVNGSHYFTKTATANVKTQNNSSRVGPTSGPHGSHQRTDTFWTLCRRCKMHYEYLKIYLNHTLLCPNCQQAFLASEVAPPFSVPKSSNLSSVQKDQNSNHRVGNANQYDPRRNAQNSAPGGSSGVNPLGPTHVHRDPFSRSGGVSSTVNSTSTAAKAANHAHLANEKLKRDREEAQSSVLQGERLLKQRRGLEGDGTGYGGNIANQMGTGHGRAGNFVPGFNNKPNSTRDLTWLEIRNMLIEKARKEIHKKLDEWSSENIAKQKKSEKEKGKALKGDADDTNGYSAGTDTKGKALKEDIKPISVDVPDPDFHDFDQDRTETCFGENQVWASYDDDDGMPRFYALIHKVISLNPFKIRISWLKSKTTDEFGPLDWRGSGFAKTCGDFRAGKYEINKSINSFSHKVKCTKGTRWSVSIYPQKGDIWALYRNWSPDWNEHTPDEVIHKYDMVEVLDDYNEDKGVSVTPLIKVSGFRTVFNQNLDPSKIKRIPREEMFRFSHQVPNYLLTGQEAPNAPKGCQELDPAATPLELLQEKAEAKEVLMENGKEVEREILDSTLEIKKDEIAGNDIESEMVKTVL